MNLQLNLATRVYIDFRKVNSVIAVLFLLALGWCTFEISILTTNFAEARNIADQMAKSVGKSSAAKITDSEYNKMLANIKLANSILNKRGYDWLSLLDNLEQTVPEGVSLRGLAPAEKGNLLKVSGTARNFTAVKKFIENLERSSKFAEVYLTDQAHIKDGTITKGISFSVTCKALS